MSSRLAVVVVIGLVMGALAGCAEKAPAEDLQQGRTPGSTRAPLDTGTSAPAPMPKGTTERWHFHDYWKGNPTILLVETNVTLNLSIRDDGTPVYGHVFALPRGVIVPPETGHLTVTVNWTTPEPGPVNLTVRPADSNDFVPFANVLKGEPVVLPTTESMADVPHRQESRWLFNLSAVAAVDPSNATPAAPQLPPRELNVRIEATIGRPLFIDPPHLNWWAQGDVIPLVTAREGAFASIATPLERNVTILGMPPEPGVRMARDNVTIPVDEGRIVPEKAKSVVVLLNWTSDVPDAKLTVRYSEENSPSAGAIELAQDGAGSRVFVLPVGNSMSDTTYSNRTTWQFHVLPDGAPAAFKGTFTLHAWATRAEPAEALRVVLG